MKYFKFFLGIMGLVVFSFTLYFSLHSEAFKIHWYNEIMKNMGWGFKVMFECDLFTLSITMIAIIFLKAIIVALK